MSRSSATDFTCAGSRRLRGGRADAAGDHRLAMAFAIAALGADSPSIISGADSVAISYPEFFSTLESLCDPSSARRRVASNPS